MGELNVVAADSVAPADLHGAFAAAFSDDLLWPLELPLEQWPVFIWRQAADLSLSRVAMRGADGLAFAFVARDAAAGLRGVELECFAQNAPGPGPRRASAAWLRAPVDAPVADAARG